MVPLLLLLLSKELIFVKATSFKMDFLSAGTVRTDALMYSKIGDCVSDHVHRFYGAVSPRSMRPDATFQDLREAPGDTGNVEENKSLYWNPVIYKVVNPESQDEKRFEIVPVWFASAYYVFRTGETTAFPEGLKMRTGFDEKVNRATSTCDGSYRCEREDEGGCNGYGPTDQEEHGFLPVRGCGELELNIKFPTCWDGVNAEAPDPAVQSHVSYALECGEHGNECFDFDCPESHPVRIPEIHLYVRILGYEGGAHMFANETDVFHSDYFSGWDVDELQTVLDNCENYSDAAMPDCFCSDWLTYKGHGKEEGVQYPDEDIVEGLQEIQPDPIDTQATICAEEVTNIPSVPRGACNGDLIPEF